MANEEATDFEAAWKMANGDWAHEGDSYAPKQCRRHAMDAWAENHRCGHTALQATPRDWQNTQAGSAASARGADSTQGFDRRATRRWPAVLAVHPSCRANASSWSMQVFQPSANPISSWRFRVALSGCITVAT